MATATSTPRPGQDVTAVPTVGVEEEFWLVRRDGTAACVAPEVLGTLADDGNVKFELVRFQVESTTGICTNLSDIAADLLRERRALARAAAVHGARLVATGTPSFDLPGISALTDKPRYRRIAEQFPLLAGSAISSACHVHVAVPSRDVAVQVVNRVRGWLPVLLALSANSPIWRGRLTGWQSYRYLVQREWPSSGIPPYCDNASDWDRAVDAAVRSGTAHDEAGVYFFARLSPRYPTVEIRIADTCLTVDDAVLLAGLCRALVATAIGATFDGDPYVDVPEQAIGSAALAAARLGLDAQLVSPLSGLRAPGTQVLRDLVQHVTPALDRAGDSQAIGSLLQQRLLRGSGAAVQAAWLWQLSPDQFLRRLAEQTLSEEWQAEIGPRR